jgi:acyl-coenzyme A synthetase/AMP-(fatty) acid ligase/acyl carrier protein
MNENRIYQALITCANECPERIALEELVTGEIITYGELLRLIDTGIAFLDSHHYPEIVVVLANMGIDSVVVYYAIVCSGRTAAMIDDDVETPHGLLLKSSFPELCVKPSDFVAYLSSFGQPINEAREIRTANEIESVLFTSGSTGEPKIFGVPSDRGRLENRILPRQNGREYAVLNTRRPSSTPYRINLQRSLLNKGRFVSVDLSNTSPSEMDRLLRGRVIDEITVTPTMVRSLFPLIKSDWIQTVQRLHVNGERTYRSDLELIFQMMPQVTVRLNYGLTEFGNVSEGLVTAQDLANVSDPVSVGVPVKDVEIRDDDSDAEMAIGQSGRVCVRGAQGFLGGLTDNGQFTFERFQIDGWQETGDRGFINDRNDLVILGRTQETVKIRGSRLSILEIEDIIHDTGMVNAVLVAVYQDAHGNDALGALVVSPNGNEFTLAELRRRITDRYSLVMCPTRSLVVGEIPVLGTGKVDRVTATTLLNEAQKEVVVGEFDMTTNVVRDAILAVLPVESLGLDEDIFESGVDSLASLEILDRLSDAFGVVLDVRVLLENSTVKSLSEALRNYVQPQNRLARLVTPKGFERAKLYWILPGANPFMAQKLAGSIIEIDHIAVLNPGALKDDVVLPIADSMIAIVVEAIVAEVNPTDHVFVAGFSSAGLFANEVARRLTDRGCIARGLIIIDPVSSQVVNPTSQYRGRVNPLHVMLGREGRLARLDPVQLDHALFGVQLLALWNLKSLPISIPTLHIGRDQTEEQRLLWGRHPMSQYLSLDISHLDFVRRPQYCSPLISQFLSKILTALE